MKPSLSLSKQSKNIWTPAITVAFLSVLMASCASTTGTTAGQDSSSSVPDTAMSSSMVAPLSSSDTTMSADTSSSFQADLTSSADSAVADTKKYADGSYSATGDYTSPGGPETIDVSLTLKNNIITDATFTGNAQGGISQRMQSNFASGYKEQVVGKSIDSLSLGVVSGSSLTPKGFMDAVQKIETQAAVK